MSRRVLVLGATSGIAVAVARALAARGAALLLAARDLEEAERTAAHLRVRYGVEATALAFDATAFETHPAFVAGLPEIEGVVLAFGTMDDQRRAQEDFPTARRMIETNYLGAVSILEVLARVFEGRRHGFIAAISSVAGDRGRASNYVYGSAKAGLTAYLSGLRNRLHASGVQVLTIKPGFVDTAMTRGLVNPRSPLVAAPDTVARDILAALDRRVGVLYTPWFWRWIMTVITLLPEALFKRLRL